MTVRDAVRQLEALDEVAHAGAAPTDVGQILCFKITVDAHHLTDDVQQRVEAAVQRSIHGDVKVSSSKDISNTSGSEKCFFWAFAYNVVGTTTVGGITYDIIAYSEDSGVIAVMSDMTGGDPSSAIERFRWSDISWQPDE